MTTSELNVELLSYFLWFILVLCIGGFLWTRSSLRKFENLDNHFDSLGSKLHLKTADPNWWREYFRLSGKKPDKQTALFFYVSLIDEMKEKEARKLCLEDGIEFDELAELERRELIESIDHDPAMSAAAEDEIRALGFKV